MFSNKGQKKGRGQKAMKTGGSQKGSQMSKEEKAKLADKMIKRVAKGLVHRMEGNPMRAQMNG